MTLDRRTRRLVLAAVPASSVAMAAMLTGIAPLSYAQDAGYPSKQIRVIVPFAAGGIADTFARVIGQKLSETWNQPVVVENRTGAGGNIGADVVAKSPADGYTLVMGNIGTHAVNAALFAHMPFDPIKDFSPIALVMEAEGLLVVNPVSNIKSVRELLERARAESATLTYGSGGRGTTSHLAGELFNASAKVRLVHVPYKGNVPAITDLLGGQTTLSFATMPTAMPYVRTGKLNALAVIGANRSTALPQVPTLAESGLPGFEVNNWIGLFGPAGMPVDIVAKLNAAVMTIMRAPEVQKRIDSEGARLVPNTPAQFAVFVQNESAKWTKVLRDAGTKPE
jgi:tripartite-type tricarboxylate transporter receptor subunit TctC